MWLIAQEVFGEEVDDDPFRLQVVEQLLSVSRTCAGEAIRAGYEEEVEIVPFPLEDDEVVDVGPVARHRSADSFEVNFLNNHDGVGLDDLVEGSGLIVDACRDLLGRTAPPQHRTVSVLKSGLDHRAPPL